MTYKDIVLSGIQELKSAGIGEYELDARLLFEEAFEVDRSFLILNADAENTNADSYEKYKDYIEKRSKRVPLQHILGYQDFMGLRFFVDGRVLIPRQDTEILVEEAIKELHDGMSVLDICTGSGCILISLLNYSNDCAGIGVDISEDALTVAKNNSDKLLTKEGTDVSFMKADILEDLPDALLGPKFDLVVSNPPYIESDVIEELEPEVKDYDPMLALDGGKDGLVFYRRLSEVLDKTLKKGGWFFFEIGYNQAEAVKELFSDEYTDIEVIKDYAGLDRVIKGRRKINV
ncbi:MAG: peptide chain release factor N(5)-glutamine methyltransferase [Lachnospiraceae bacterium]|nr:peptide chain release factor N(5)-glutamine methyltransferase [Lachnospiraceae bacterium]